MPKYLSLTLTNAVAPSISNERISKTIDRDLPKRNGLYYELFSPNLANGQYEIYHDDGKILSRENFKDGIRHGLYERFGGGWTTIDKIYL